MPWSFERGIVCVNGSLIRHVSEGIDYPRLLGEELPSEIMRSEWRERVAVGLFRTRNYDGVLYSIITLRGYCIV